MDTPAWVSAAGSVQRRGGGGKRAGHEASGALGMAATAAVAYLLIFTPASWATPASVVCAAFKPSMKSLSE